MQLRLARNAQLEASAEPPKRRLVSPTAISLVLHVVLGVALWNALLVPAGFQRLLTPRETTPRTGERVEFVTTAPAANSAVAPARPGQPSARPAAQEPPPLVAPTEVPASIPEPAKPGAPVPSSLSGSGPPGALAGGTGPSRGAQPTYVDPRVWVEAPPLVYAPKTDEERLDSALVTTLRRTADSLAANTHTPNKFERGDWTVERNGKKYGIDQKYIHLGSFSIPTALLALLPLNRAQGNPIAMDRDREMAFMHSDIQYHAQAALTEAQFRAAVNAIRERKDREHRGLGRTVAGSIPGDPRTLVAPGERPPQ